MSRIALSRSYGETYTAGVFLLPGIEIYTVERPWVPRDDCRGGVPFESCIPEGEYEVRRFTRRNGDLSWVLVNDSLGVYERKEDRPRATDRYSCLIHPGNTVEDVVGCIAPGMNRSAKIKTGGGLSYRVNDSRTAMGFVDAVLARVTRITIREMGT